MLKLLADIVRRATSRFKEDVYGAIEAKFLVAREAAKKRNERKTGTREDAKTSQNVRSHQT